MTSSNGQGGASARALFNSCGADENCSADIVAPNGYTFLSFTYNGSSPCVTGQCSVYIAEDSSATSLVSDQLNLFQPGTNGINSTTFFINFLSDGDVPIAFACNQVPTTGKCDFVKNGLSQSAGTVTWINSSTGDKVTDSVFFVSDVESAPAAVPEPACIVLIGTALIGAAKLCRRTLK